MNLNPYICRDGQLIWRRDPRVVIGTVFTVLPAKEWAAICDHCQRDYRRTLLRDVNADLYHHFIEEHAT